jgi:hypothetical protein
MIMSFSFSSLVRLIVLLAMGTTMIAVGVARLDPPKPTWRAKRPVSHVNVNEYYLGVRDRTPRWLDVDTGRLSAYPLEGDDVLEVANCSPWVDQEGRRQVVGRWSSRTPDGPMSVSSDFGLARYVFPGGQLLDQISTEIVPVSPPCWFPGTRARILFASGDGMLYHFAFEPEPWLKAQGVSEPGHDSRPRPLTWRCPKPGKGEVYMSDLTWPDDPRMEGRVVVALREQENEPSGTRSFSRSRLWWLKLNHAGTDIIDSGRLVAPELKGDDSDDLDQRSPTVGTLHDGRTVLAYFQQSVGKTGWDLRMASIRFEGEGHAPTALHKDSRLLSGRCQPTHTSFSTDGRWLNAITGQAPTEGRVARLPIADVFPVESRP